MAKHDTALFGEGLRSRLVVILEALFRTKMVRVLTWPVGQRHVHRV